MSACRPRFPLLSDEGSQNMVIIGVDPHKSVHVASAVDPATNRRIDTIKAEASLAGYRRLLRWADKLGERRWAIENARELGATLPSGSSLVTKSSMTCRRPRPPGSETSLVADGARTTSSMPQRQPAWPRCRAMPTRWSPRT